MAETLTPEAHKARNERLDQALYEIATDFMDHHRQGPPRSLAHTSVLELMNWSAQRAKHPDDLVVALEDRA